MKYAIKLCIPLFVKVVTTVLERTSSGGFCSNDGIVHMTLPGLPFGGVGKAESITKWTMLWTMPLLNSIMKCIQQIIEC